MSEDKQNKERSEQRQFLHRYAVHFDGCHDTFEQVFGRENLTFAQLQSRLWHFVRDKDRLIETNEVTRS